ncbi:hypothetical protein ACFTXM_31865 [Streptomyces sp. NPDC056930]|uniref:hypothetical protein n=1 Tax=Streptomyces sp. NPDC056930 TaxID=3345967 RepID=UPI003637BDDE
MELLPRVITTAKPGPEADFVQVALKVLVISAYDLEQAGEAFGAGTLGKIALTVA